MFFLSFLFFCNTNNTVDRAAEDGDDDDDIGQLYSSFIIKILMLTGVKLFYTLLFYLNCINILLLTPFF